MLSNISKYDKITFASAMTVGILAHGQGLFNKFSYHDDANSLFAFGATYNVGRWLLAIIGDLEKLFFGDANFSLPLYNGIIALLCIAIVACLFVRGIGITNEKACLFVGGVFACFPTVTTAFGYIFGAHIIMFGLLLGISGAYLVCRSSNKVYIICGIVMMAGSVGIYQAFIPIVLSFILLCCIDDLIMTTEDNVKKTIVTIWIKPLYVLTFMAIYFAINKLYLGIRGEHLADYMGVNAVGEVPLTEYLIRVGVAYKQFVFPSRNTTFFMYPSNVLVLYYLLGTIGVVYAVYLLYCKFKKSVHEGIMLLLLLFLVPLSTNFIIVMTGTIAHSYMTYAAVTPFVLVAYLVEKVGRNIFGFIRKTALVFFSCLLIMYVRYDNKCYLLANFAQQESISYYTTLITRIKSAEGYKDEYPVMFVNQGNIKDESLKGIEATKRKAFADVNISPYWDVKFIINNYAWLDFVKNWCGYEPSVISENEVDVNYDIDSMPSYPDYGSIVVDNEVVIVKF